MVIVGVLKGEMSDDAAFDPAAGRHLPDGVCGASGFVQHWTVVIRLILDRDQARLCVRVPESVYNPFIHS